MDGDSNHITDYAATFAVRNLEAQAAFYTETVGLQLQWKTEQEAGLGACQFNILRLTRAAGGGSNEVLRIDVPSRRELAKVVGRLCTIKYPNKPTDHGDRHSTHLTDPEGNRIEIGVNVPGEPAAPAPLDIEALFNELDPDDRLCDKMSDETKLSASGH